MDNDGRPDEEQVAVLSIDAHKQIMLMMRQDFALLRRPAADQLSAHVRADDVTLPHIAYPEHETEFAVPLADHGVSREQQGLCALFRPRHLGEHDAHLRSFPIP